MITVQEAKTYLNIDYDDHDGLIESFIEAAHAYLNNAVDNFDLLYEQDSDFKKLADLVAKFFVGELYDNREQMQAEKNTSFMYRSIITQMQLFKAKEVNEDA